MEEKRFIITEKDKEEIMILVRSHNYVGIRNYFLQLPTLEEFLKSNQLNNKEVKTDGNVQ